MILPVVVLSMAKNLRFLTCVQNVGTARKPESQESQNRLEVANKTY